MVLFYDDINFCYKEKNFIIHIVDHHQCSAQGQVLHCKRRNLGCSCADGSSSIANSGTKAAVLLGI